MSERIPVANVVFFILIASVIICLGIYCIYIEVKPVSPQASSVFNTEFPSSLSVNGTQVYRRFVALSKKPVWLRVTIKEQVKSVQGYWYASHCQVKVNGENVMHIRPDNVKRQWSEKILYGNEEELHKDAEPAIGFELPLTTKDLHKVINITADMKVFVPEKMLDQFRTDTKIVQSRFKLFVVTAKEFEALHYKKNVGTLVGGIFLLSLGLLVGVRIFWDLRNQY